MERNDIIENTLLKIRQLPDDKIKEMHDFAEFLLMKIEDQILQHGIQDLTSNSKAFSYLNEEEDLYSVNDLKERYILTKKNSIKSPISYTIEELKQEVAEAENETVTYSQDDVNAMSWKK